MKDGKQEVPHVHSDIRKYIYIQNIEKKRRCTARWKEEERERRGTKEEERHRRYIKERYRRNKEKGRV